MHAVYPTGRPPFDIAQIFDEPELKTLRGAPEGEEEEPGEGAAAARATCSRRRRRTRAALDIPARAPKVDLALEALAPVARGEVPLVIRADAEDDIRGAVAFARERGLKLIDRRRPGGLALRGRAQGRRTWRCW